MLTPEQVKARRDKIGGSDVAAILGKDPNKTSFAVAQRITGQIQSDDLEGLDHIEIGNMMEAIATVLYEKKNKTKLFSPETRYHPKHKFLSANIDRIRQDRMDVGIEIKNVGAFSREEWGEQMTDEVPDRVLLQVQHYMLVCPEFKLFHVPRIFGGNSYQMFVVPRNDRLIAQLEEIEVEFYQAVMRGILPEPDWGHRTTKDTLKRAFTEVKGIVQNMPELDHWTAAWEEACAERLRLQKLEESLKNHIEHMMGNAEIGVLSDGRRWRRAQVSRKAYEVEASSYIETRLLKK